MERERVSLRIDKKVLDRINEYTKGDKKALVEDLVIKYVDARGEQDMLFSPLGFAKDMIYMVSVSKNTMDRVRVLAEKHHANESEVIRLAILDWYLTE